MKMTNFNASTTDLKLHPASAKFICYCSE